MLQEVQSVKKKREEKEIKNQLVISKTRMGHLAKCMEADHQGTSVFGVLRPLKSLTAEEILKRSSNIVSAYLDDMEESL